MEQLRLEVAQKQSELADAQRRLAAAEHAEDVANLRKVRADLASARQRFDELRHKLEVAAAAVINLQRRLDAVVIPADPEPFEEDAWAEERRKALAKVQQLRAQRRDATISRDQLKLEAVYAAKAYEQLVHAERNLRTKAEGHEVASGFKGGVFPV
jgi:uncharacterized coiled-coil DUF342 family protein